MLTIATNEVAQGCKRESRRKRGFPQKAGRDAGSRLGTGRGRRPGSVVRQPFEPCHRYAVFALAFSSFSLPHGRLLLLQCRLNIGERAYAWRKSKTEPVSVRVSAFFISPSTCAGILRRLRTHRRFYLCASARETIDAMKRSIRWILVSVCAFGEYTDSD